MRPAVTFLSVAILAAATACTSYVEPQDVHNRLEADGYGPGTSQPLVNTFFNIAGTVIPIRDEGEFNVDFDPQIQFYVFESVEAARTAAAGVSEDGFSYTWGLGPGDGRRQKIVEWLHPPTFFQSGDAIVIYLGEDHCIRQELRDIMGEPFAGVPVTHICERL